MIESAIIDSRLAQVCGTGRWSNPIHYHSSEISWSRVVPVGRGTGLGTIKLWQADLATGAHSQSVHECSFDSRNLMLLLEDLSEIWRQRGVLHLSATRPQPKIRVLLNKMKSQQNAAPTINRRTEGQ
jgi:hypothetical protein